MCILAIIRPDTQNGWANPAKKSENMQFFNMPGHLIRRLNQISVALFGERMAEAGVSLTPMQYALLCGIRAHPQIDQATLAGMAACDRVTLGKVLDRLQERGLITRAKSASDKRAKVLILTDEGRATLESAVPFVRDVQLDILGGLDEGERAVFVDMLRKLTQAGNESSRAPMKAPPKKKSG